MLGVGSVPVAFPGLTLTHHGDVLLLRSARPLRFVASTVVGGGVGAASAVVSLRVARTFDCGRPAALLRARAAALGVRGRFIGFLTALDLARAAVLEAHEPRMLVLATAGTSNATAPGRSAAVHADAGTINITAVLDVALAPAALIAAVKVITEAKTLALLEAGVRTADGGYATGTSTDAVAVGQTGTGARRQYAGPVTPTGHTLGRLVTEAVHLSLAGGNLTTTGGRRPPEAEGEPRPASGRRR
jgi:adenosylcobinamide hydrolase